MIGGLIALYTLAMVLIVTASVVLRVGVKYTRRARELSVKADKYVAMVEDRTRKEQNKIASLSPEEFHKYISNMFSRMIEISAAANATLADPDVYERLFAYSLHRLTTYLGQETIDAIEYHYGVGYLDRFCTNAFVLLMTRRELGKILNNAQRSDAIEATISKFAKLD